MAAENLLCPHRIHHFLFYLCTKNYRRDGVCRAFDENSQIDANVSVHDCGEHVQQYTELDTRDVSNILNYFNTVRDVIAKGEFLIKEKESIPKSSNMMVLVRIHIKMSALTNPNLEISEYGFLS